MKSTPRRRKQKPQNRQYEYPGPDGTWIIPISDRPLARLYALHIHTIRRYFEPNRPNSPPKYEIKINEVWTPVEDLSPLERAMYEC